MFDPYSEWLGIENNQRPVTSQQLLGLPAKGADRTTIVLAAASAAERVRPHKDGPHAQVCNRLLREIDRAKESLLNPSKPQAEDAPDQDDADGDVDANATAASSANGSAEPAFKKRKKKLAARVEPKKAGSAKVLVIGIVAAVVLIPLLLGGVILAVVFLSGSKPKTQPEVASGTPTQPSLLQLPGTEKDFGKQLPDGLIPPIQPTKADPGPTKPMDPAPMPPPMGPPMPPPMVDPGIADPPKPPDPGPAAPKPPEKNNDPGTPVGPARPTGPPKEIGGESLEDWVKKLKDPDPSTRDAAIRVIPMFGKPAEEYIPKLIPLMVSPSEKDLTVRISALRALTSNGIEKKEHINAIINNLNDCMVSQHESLRLQAVMAAGRMGSHVRNNTYIRVQLLAKLKDQSSYEVRHAAAQALAAIYTDKTEGPPYSVINGLIGAISDPALAVRVEAVQSLIFLGPPRPTENFGPLVTEAEKQKERDAKQKAWDDEKKAVDLRLNRKDGEKDPILKLWLRVLTIRLDGSQLTPQLTAIADELDKPKTRLQAVEAFSYMGKDAEPFAHRLADALKTAKLDDPADFHFAMMCMYAMGKMGPTGTKAAATVMVPRLVETLKNAKVVFLEDFQLVVGCLEALGTLGPDAAEAIPELTRWATHKEEVFRNVATKSLNQINGKAADKNKKD